MMTVEQDIAGLIYEAAAIIHDRTGMWQEGWWYHARRMMAYSDDRLVEVLRQRYHEDPGVELSFPAGRLYSEDEVVFAWYILRGRHGGDLARRLIFEESLCDSLDWEVAVPEQRLCSILGIHSGRVVCAENSGNDPLVANRRICLGAWELFVVIKNEDGSVSIKSATNEKYVSARPLPEGTLIAEGNKADEWEKFDIKEVAGRTGVFSILSRHTGKYVSVDENSGNVLVANRDAVGEWEEFRLYCQSRG